MPVTLEEDLLQVTPKSGSEDVLAGPGPLCSEEQGTAPALQGSRRSSRLQKGHAYVSFEDDES